MKARTYPVCRFLSGFPCLALLAAGVLPWISSGVQAQGEDPDGGDGIIIVDPPHPMPCPTLRAGDILEPGKRHQDLHVHFPWWLNVDRESLGDGDVTVSGVGGYLQRGKLVGIDEFHDDFPIPMDPLADNVIDVPQGGPVLVATYRIFPPSPAEAWEPPHNGSYAVSLGEGQVSMIGGGALPPKLLGGFRVAIRAEGEPVPVQPAATKIDIGNRPAAGLFAGEPDPSNYYATVQLFFEVPHVQVEFLELRREANTFVAHVDAVKLPIDGELDVPIIGPDGVVLDEPAALAVRTKIYGLGELEPGDYRFVVRVNGEREGVEEFAVGEGPPGDQEPPAATLHVRHITAAGGSAHRMEVVFEDPSGVDLSTLGDGDLMVLSPCLFLDVNPPFPCAWEAQRAKLVGVLSASDDLRRVVGLYQIAGPTDGWTHEHNGFYPVVWRAGEVCDRAGNCNRESRIGGFEVAIRPGGEPPIPAEAEVVVDAADPEMVVANVHVDFREHFGVVEQGIRREGNRIFLEARAVPLAIPAIFPPPPPPSEDLLFEIGPLGEGAYVAVFVMNGHAYDAAEFRVGRPSEPPIPAEVRLEVDPSDPEKVYALVEVQFQRHHHLEQGEVRVDGHQIVLPAKAEPLPVDDHTPGVPPQLHQLRYEIGALPPGGFIAIFSMNEFPYAVERFVIDDPGSPIPATVGMEILTEDPGAVVARVKVAFESPHVIEARDLHREGNRFILVATARPIRPAEDPNDPDRNTVILEYPLGALDEGDYGAVFVMNGFPYEDASFSIRRGGEFGAHVELAVDPTDPAAVAAKAAIRFENPLVMIDDPGTPRREGNLVIIDAKAVAANFVREPDDQPIQLNYELGAFPPGEYVLVYLINGNPEARAPFRVDTAAPIPADVALAVRVDGSSAVAHATVQFRDHYRIVGREVVRQGARFFIDLEVEGPLPILAPVPPPPIELEIPLADDLENGEFLAALRMRGYLYAHDAFTVHDDPFAVEVDLEVGKSTTGYKAGAVVDFKNPYVLVTDPGEVVRRGDVFEISATAEEVVFVQEPSGEPQRFSYELGAPDPGHYSVVYLINGRPEAHARFRVEPDREPPIANIAGIEIAQGDASWFADVGVILLPGQRVTGWGEVRRSDGEFHVDITVDWVDFPHEPDGEPIDPNLVPDGIELIGANGDALIAGSPVHLVRHQYVLGVLEEGAYRFVVHSRGQTVARKAFEVAGSGPSADLHARDILEQPDGPYLFSINYGDPDGLDHDSIREARVVVHGPDGFEAPGELREYASTDDVPSTAATAVYAIEAPGGEWDPGDNGRYCVSVDPEAVRDLNGNTLQHGRLGCFHVRLMIEPPHNETEVRVSVGLEGDQWVATVEVVPAPGTAITVADWGEVMHHGSTHLALATVSQEQTPNGPLAEPLAHRYPLGPLRPGTHVFVFKTNLAHCGIERFRVPGMEGDPVDDWREIAGIPAGEDNGDGDRNGLFAEYFFALDPNRADLPHIEPEIVEDEEGGRHLALRFRRLILAEGVRQIVEASRDLRRWDEVDDLIDVVEKEVNIDGTEELLVCLRERLREGGYRWLRIRVVPAEE